MKNKTNKDGNGTEKLFALREACGWIAIKAAGITLITFVAGLGFSLAIDYKNYKNKKKQKNENK